MVAEQTTRRDKKKLENCLFKVLRLEFIPSFVQRFCPKCKRQTNMVLWGTGADHETAKCIHCGKEWIFSVDPVTGKIGGLIGQSKSYKSLSQDEKKDFEKRHPELFGHKPKAKPKEDRSEV